MVALRFDNAVHRCLCNQISEELKLLLHKTESSTECKEAFTFCAQLFIVFGSTKHPLKHRAGEATGISHLQSERGTKK